MCFSAGLQERFLYVRRRQRLVPIIVYGIDKISTELNDINITEISKLFKTVTPDDICRPSGEIDVLIGFEYAGHHPTKKECNNHLLLLENRLENAWEDHIR